MMDAILATMVTGPGQLRYGCAKFDGAYFVQVMRGALDLCIVIPNVASLLAWRFQYCSCSLDLAVRREGPVAQLPF